MKKSKAKKLIAILGISCFIIAGAFAFGAPTALASFVVNAWQGYRLTQGLVGYWTFDGKDINWGTSMTNDVSGQGKHGTMVSMSTTTSPTLGKIGQAVSFDGVNDEVKINSAINVTTFSASFWAKTASPSQAAGIIIGDNGANEGGGNKIGFVSGSIFVRAGGTQCTSVAVPTDGNWHHWVILRNSGNNSTVYLDGRATDCGTGPGSATYALDTIGANGNNDQLFVGTLDEVRFYSRALPLEEIQRLYQMGNSFKINVSHRDELTQGLVGAWTFDGKDTNWEASITDDVSGQGKHSKMVNMGTTTSPILGVIGQALTFDGSDDYVSSNASLSSANYFTLSFWMNPDTVGSNRDVIQWGNIYVEMFNDEFRIFNSGGDCYHDTSVTNLLAKQWSHIILTYDESSNVKLYVNGVSQTLSCVSDANFTPVSATLTLGNNTYNSRYQGKLDEVRVYSRVLSGEEIKRLYQMGNSFKTNVTHRDELSNLSSSASSGNISNSLVGYWTFDGKDMDIGSSTKEVYDVSGNRNHGNWKEHATTTTIGKIGQAIDLDGVDDYVEVADDSTLDFSDTDNMTITGWFYRRTSNTIDVLFGKRAGTLAAHTGYAAWIAAAGDDLVFEISDGTDEYALNSTSIFTTPGWNFYAIVWDQSSAANTEIYINGVADNAADTPPGGGISAVGSLSNAQPIVLGALSDATFPFDGKQDDVRIYKRALSSEEIRRLYLMGK